MTRIFWKRFIGAWLIALFSLQLTRLVFYLNLRSYFDGSVGDLLNTILIGFEFDAVTVAYLLGPFFVALPFLQPGWSSKLAKWFFLGMLGAMNFLNCSDAEFFKFTARRSTDDIFEFAFLSNDIFNIAPNLVSQFWYLLLAFLVIMLIAFRFMGLILSSDFTKTKLWLKALAIIPTAIVLVVAARGGFHPIPLSIIDAGKISNPKLSAVALSTPFTIIKTIGKPELKRYEFPADETVEVNPIRKQNKTQFSGKLKQHNVVIIIVESLSTEYVESLNGLGKGYTPFIDSLCNKALVFENAFANGHRSIEGIAAISASIPTLMYEPYTTSRYAGNKINSLANLLKEKGYYASFMHGGNKNSMNFESFASQAGYDQFYDRDDYPFSDEHYDGVWGIPDHYMFNQCIQEFNEFKKPFFSTIFTLSSHNPYTIPKEYQNKFPKGSLPIHESIGYADESLRQFFHNASQTEWYQNTLFVITADHTSLSEHPKFQSKLGSLRIPVIFFHPSDTLIFGRKSQAVQQVDIMPTVLDLLGHDKPFFSFGVNALDEHQEHIAVAFKHDQHQLYRKGFLICFDGENTNFVYDVAKDENLHQNVVDSQDHQSNEEYLKGYLMTYSKALNENRMTYDTWTRDDK